MTKDELIAKQQLEIEHYRAERKDVEQRLAVIRGRFTSIGAPLNDNFLQFNKEQLGWCRTVFAELECVEISEPDTEN